MIKLGNVEFNENELQELYANGKKFIVQFRAIYQVFYSKNMGFYANKIYNEYGKLPLTKKGRYFMGNAKFVNDLLGKELVVD